MWWFCYCPLPLGLHRYTFTWRSTICDPHSFSYNQGGCIGENDQFQFKGEYSITIEYYKQLHSLCLNYCFYTGREFGEGRLWDKHVGVQPPRYSTLVPANAGI